MANKNSWKVTVCRIGSGCMYTAIAPARREAYNLALLKAGKEYVKGDGRSWAESEGNYQPDLTADFRDCFNRAFKLIGYNLTCPRASAENSARSAHVEIERL